MHLVGVASAQWHKIEYICTSYNANNDKKYVRLYFNLAQSRENEHNFNQSQRRWR